MRKNTHKLSKVLAMAMACFSFLLYVYIWFVGLVYTIPKVVRLVKWIF